MMIIIAIIIFMMTMIIMMIKLPKRRARATHQGRQDVRQQFSSGTVLHSFHMLLWGQEEQ
jgi:heme/copper-type cytochrome/quinol oxidase subunit 2